MIKPRWSLAGIAFFGSAAIAGAIFFASRGSEEEAMPEDQTSASSDAAPEPCTTMIPVTPLATPHTVDPSLPWIPADWATYVDPDSQFSFRYPPDLFAHERYLTTWDPKEWNGPGLPPSSMRISIATSPACAPTECGGMQLRQDGTINPTDAAFHSSGGRAWFGSEISQVPINGISRTWELAILDDFCLHMVFEYSGIEWLERGDSELITSSILIGEDVAQSTTTAVGSPSRPTSSSGSQTSRGRAPDGCLSGELAQEDPLGRFALCYPADMTLRTSEPQKGESVVEVGYYLSDGDSLMVTVGWDGVRESLCRGPSTGFEERNERYENRAIDGREVTVCFQDLHQDCTTGSIDRSCAAGAFFATALDTALMLDMRPLFISVTYTSETATRDGVSLPDISRRILDSINIY